MVDEHLDLTVRGRRLHVRRWGAPSARLVIGVPGLTGTSASFGVLGSRLGGASLQLVAVDPRGRGRSEVTGPGTYGWEHHALDVLAIADELGTERFSVAGQSMGASVAMKVAELDAARLDAVVLLDVAGRVDPGIGPVIAGILDRLGVVYPSADAYLDEVRAQGLIDPWSDDWEAQYRDELEDVPGGVRLRADPDAVQEDRAYTWTQDPYARWAHLTMPTLLVRAARELRAGSGFTVPADDVVAFRRDVPEAQVVEIDANHITVNAHPETARAIAQFLERSVRKT